MSFLDSLVGSVGTTTGNLLWALVILVVGWIIALIIRAALRGLLKRTQIDDKIVKIFTEAGETKPIDAEKWISQIVYYILLLIVFVAAFEQLGLTTVLEPLNAFLNTIWGFIPNLLAAGVLFLVAWVVATLVRWLLRTVFKAIKLDKHVGDQAEMEGEEPPSVGHALAEAAYWFVWVLFLAPILGALGMQSLMQPVQGVIDQILGYLPNIIWAAAIALVGWFVARVVRRIVASFLAAIGLDKLGERWGLDRALGTQTLSGLVGLIVYTLILLVVLISALDALAIEAISAPAIAMLQSILNAVPGIVGAIIVLVIAYFVGKLVGDLVANLLAGIGFNKVLVWLKLGQEPEEGQRTPSEFVGYVVLVVVMLLAVTGAAELLGFGSMTEYVTTVLAFIWQIAIALVVFGLGLFLANLARKAVQAVGGARGRLLGQVAWWAIVLFVGALALGQTGISQQIVNMAFTLGLGAIAVAAALAFGLGGREVAGRELEGFVKSFKEENKE
jgi:small-conductance mechanosensitive channel